MRPQVVLLGEGNGGRWGASQGGDPLAVSAARVDSRRGPRAVRSDRQSARGPAQPAGPSARRDAISGESADVAGAATRAARSHRDRWTGRSPPSVNGRHLIIRVGSITKLVSCFQHPTRRRGCPTRRPSPPGPSGGWPGCIRRCRIPIARMWASCCGESASNVSLVEASSGGSFDTNSIHEQCLDYDGSPAMAAIRLPTPLEQQTGTTALASWASKKPLAPGKSSRPLILSFR